jgi:hypothetical protein
MSTPNPFSPPPAPTGNSPIEKSGQFVSGNTQQFHPAPHGKEAPGGTVEARTAVAELQNAQKAVDARHAKTNDAASAARVAKGLGTLAETVAHLEAQKGKPTATSQTTAPAKPAPVRPDLREQNRKKIAAAEKAGGQVVSGAIFGKFF